MGVSWLFVVAVRQYKEPEALSLPTGRDRDLKIQKLRCEHPGMRDFFLANWADSLSTFSPCVASLPVFLVLQPELLAQMRRECGTLMPLLRSFDRVVNLAGLAAFRMIGGAEKSAQHLLCRGGHRDQSPVSIWT